MNQQIDTIIIGAGMSGLTVAHKLRTSCYGHRFLVLEKTDGCGGAVRTHSEGGFIAEIGPHGFLDNCAESRLILEETGLDRECIKSPLINFVRYVYVDGALRMIPQTPAKILLAPLIPWRAKLRVLADLWKTPLPGQPTVAKWVDYRFGSALLPYVDAVFTGTYAGDMNSLTIDSVMPGVRKLEKEHGSVIRGLFHKGRSAKRLNRGRARQFSMPAMTSFPRGMQRLPQRLAEFLQEDRDLLLNCQVSRLDRDADGWHVESSRGRFSADNIVLAVPANAAIQLLGNLNGRPPLGSVPEAGIITVVFGFGPGTTLPPGFGYLTPEQEQRFSLGTLFSSNMFPGRAPAGHILFETLIGGRRHPERLELADEELIRCALADVGEVLNLRGDPVFTRVLRPWGPIPQLEEHYQELLQWRDGLLQQHTGIYICGFGWEGIGLNDMMKSAVHVAEEIQAGATNKTRETVIKGVYF